MKSFQLPALPASCFGLALNTITEDFEGKREHFDKGVIWFADKKTKKSKPISEEFSDNIADTLHPVVADKRKAPPGSAERIAALADFYSGGWEVSAFEKTDEEIADQMVYTFIKLLKSSDERTLSPKSGKGERRREKRRNAE